MFVFILVLSIIFFSPASHLPGKAAAPVADATLFSWRAIWPRGPDGGRGCRGSQPGRDWRPQSSRTPGLCRRRRRDGGDAHSHRAFPTN